MTRHTQAIGLIDVPEQAVWNTLGTSCHNFSSTSHFWLQPVCKELEPGTGTQGMDTKSWDRQLQS